MFLLPELCFFSSVENAMFWLLHKTFLVNGLDADLDTGDLGPHPVKDKLGKHHGFSNSKYIELQVIVFSLLTQDHNVCLNPDQGLWETNVSSGH